MGNETFKFQIQLIEAMQAGKTITVNEAFCRIDQLIDISVKKREANSPPQIASNGDCYIVSRYPTGEWIGKENNLAYIEDDTWKFIRPRDGQRIWIQETSEWATYFSASWHYGALAIGVEASLTKCEIISFEIDLSGESYALSDIVIPEKSIVLGITGVVVDEVIGVPFLSVGVPESYNRYGEHYFLEAGAKIIGLTSSPIVYFSDTQMAFAGGEGRAPLGGRMRIAIHIISISS